MKKKLFFIILFVLCFFMSSISVKAVDEKPMDFYYYYDYPVVGEVPSDTLLLKIKFADGTFEEHTVNMFWNEYDLIDYNSEPSFTVFREGYRYRFDYNDEQFDSLYNDNYYINNEYYNDVHYSDDDITYGFIPLPSRKYDNKSSGLVRITDISLDSKSTTTVINESPSFKDLDVSFGFGFTSVDDYVKYKVTVQNDDTDDYVLRDNEMISESGYVKYELDFDEGTDIIKANSTKTFDITVKYVKEVPDNLLSDGVYTESNTSKLVFSNNDVVNPNTSNKILFILGLLSVIFIGLLFIKVNNKEVKALLIIISCILLLVPVSINALKEISIGVRADIKVQRVKKFCVQDFYIGCGDNAGISERHFYNFYPGTKIYELLLDYKNINDNFGGLYFFEGNVYFTNDLSNYYHSSGFNNYELYNRDDLVLDSSQGCYINYLDGGAC